MHEPTPRATHDLATLLLRVTFGGLMLVEHGIGKIGRLRAEEVQFADPLGLGAELSLQLAISAEVGCAVLLVLGVATRIVVLPLAFTMLVAAFIVHGADPLGDKEMALLYLAAYVSLILLGPGRLSVSQLWQHSLSERPALAWWLR